MSEDSNKGTKVELSKKQAEEVAKLATKSAKIRALAGMGMDRGDISRFLGIRYQHVRNVLITPIKAAR